MLLQNRFFGLWTQFKFMNGNQSLYQKKIYLNYFQIQDKYQILKWHLEFLFAINYVFLLNQFQSILHNIKNLNVIIFIFLDCRLIVVVY